MKIKEITETASAGGMSSGSVATSTGAGNGFLNGGPGTMKRVPTKKKASKKKKR